jgi:4-cresol dehydrogenase (hydroxylating)
MPDLDRGSDGYWATVAAVRRALDPGGIIAPGRYEPPARRDDA